MLIKKNLLGENCPNADFFVTSGHKVLVNGKIIKAGKIPGARRVKVKPELVYSICVASQSIIRVNNMDVVAWGYDKWLAYSKEHRITWTNNKEDELLTVV